METRRNRLVRAVVTFALTGAVSGILASSVQAIDRVENARDCSRRTDFLMIFNNDGKFCFANKGEMNVLIANVTSCEGGYNNGYIETNKGRFPFEQGKVTFTGLVTVTRIVIY